jgi:hypothetical protein
LLFLDGGIVEANARIEDQLMPQKNCEAKDEMNLAEFPLCALAHRLNPEIKTLTFEDQIRDKGRSNQLITRQLTITGSAAFGLPTEKDDEVLLGLIQLTRARGFSDRKVPFTRHELIRILGWRDDSKSYARIEESLNRWTGVTLYYKNGWWNKERKAWMNVNFHILDNVWLCHRGQPPPDTGLLPVGAPQSAFVWNEIIFRSFTHGNLKSIDFEFFKSLKSAIAKRLYRFLDKHFYKRHRFKMHLRELCCEHVGLSRNYDTANLKRKLMSGVKELEERGFLLPMAMSEQFIKLRRGEWEVVFLRAPATLAPAQEQSTYDDLTKSLIERGVTASAAVRMIASHPEERIRRQVQHFDWLTKRQLKTPGFLIASIRQDYSPPGGYVATVTDVRQKSPAPKPAQLKSNAPARRVLTSDVEELLRQQRIERFWSSFSEHERSRLQANALANASPIQKTIIERDRAFADSTRKALLDAFALNAIAGSVQILTPGQPDYGLEAFATTSTGDSADEAS